MPGPFQEQLEQVKKKAKEQAEAAWYSDQLYKKSLEAKPRPDIYHAQATENKRQVKKMEARVKSPHAQATENKRQVKKMEARVKSLSRLPARLFSSEATKVKAMQDLMEAQVYQHAYNVQVKKLIGESQPKSDSDPQGGLGEAAVNMDLVWDNAHLEALFNIKKSNLSPSVKELAEITDNAKTQADKYILPMQADAIKVLTTKDESTLHDAILKGELVKFPAEHMVQRETADTRYYPQLYPSLVKVPDNFDPKHLQALKPYLRSAKNIGIEGKGQYLELGFIPNKGWGFALPKPKGEKHTGRNEKKVASAILALLEAIEPKPTPTVQKTTSSNSSVTEQDENLRKLGEEVTAAQKEVSSFKRHFRTETENQAAQDRLEKAEQAVENFEHEDAPKEGTVPALSLEQQEHALVKNAQKAKEQRDGAHTRFDKQSARSPERPAAYSAFQSAEKEFQAANTSLENFRQLKENVLAAQKKFDEKQKLYDNVYLGAQNLPSDLRAKPELLQLATVSGELDQAKRGLQAAQKALNNFKSSAPAAHTSPPITHELDIHTEHETARRHSVVTPQEKPPPESDNANKPGKKFRG